MAKQENTLLAEVKEYLGITWSCDDAKITNFINNGKNYLDGIRGAAADYSAAGLPRQLLFDYVRYARDYALDVFEDNFRPLLIAMQTDRRLDDAEENSEP